MKITRNIAEKDFSHLKSIVKNRALKNDFAGVCSLLQCCANLGYHLNFKYSDAELEQCLADLADVLPPAPDIKTKHGKWLFYDCFGLDNRALTQQYLTALDKWGVEYLYILEKPASLNGSKNILKQVNNNPKAQLYIIDPLTAEDFTSRSDMLEELQKTIEDYAPEKAFLQIAPWSVYSIILWNKYKDRICRYLIDLTDHAFWLGSCCIDYSIEFRDYGCNISSRYRAIPDNHIIKQTYYPVFESSGFQGLPDAGKDKVIIFTGGNFYKMYGKNFFFLNLLKQVLDDNEKAVILIAGSGDIIPLRQFIKKYSLESRMIYIGNRSDISEVFKNIDIYVNTYPVIGGLMSQYAVLNRKPLIGYNDVNLPCNDAEGLFNRADSRFTYFSVEEFHRAINRLINDSEYRKKYVEKYDGLIPTEDEFAHELDEKINHNKNVGFEHVDVDIDAFSEVYFDMENNYLKRYDIIKFRCLKMKYFKYDFFGAVNSFIRIMANNRQLIFEKLMSRLGVRR